MSWFETPDDDCTYRERVFCDDGAARRRHSLLGGDPRLASVDEPAHGQVCFSAATARLEDERATPGVDPHLLRPITIPILMAMKS
jgi:hypothetical protein